MNLCSGLLLMLFPAVYEYQQYDDNSLHDLTPCLRNIDNGQKIIQYGHDDCPCYGSYISALSSGNGGSADDDGRYGLCIVAGAHIQEAGTVYPTRKKPETAAMTADIRYTENVTLPVCIPENLAACSLVPTEYIFLP